MERLASIMMEDLSLYKQCHHCKKINLAVNKICWNCTFPQLDDLTSKTIDSIKSLEREGESIYIANLVPEGFSPDKVVLETSKLKEYIYNFPRENPIYFTLEELEDLAAEYGKISYEDVIKSLQELEITETIVNVSDVYCSMSLLLLNK